MSDSPRTPTDASPEPGTRAPLAPIDILAFVSELFAFVTLAIWGFTSWPLPWNIVIGIVAPVAAILVWALFVSPRAVFAVHPFVRAVIEILVYAAAGMAWWSMGATWLGLGYGVVAIVIGVLAGRRRFA